MTFDLPNAFYLTAIATITLGVYMLSPAYSLVVLGILLGIFGFLLDIVE